MDVGFQGTSKSINSMLDEAIKLEKKLTPEEIKTVKAFVNSKLEKSDDKTKNKLLNIVSKLEQVGYGDKKIQKIIGDIHKREPLKSKDVHNIILPKDVHNIIFELEPGKVPVSKAFNTGNLQLRRRHEFLNSGAPLNKFGVKSFKEALEFIQAEELTNVDLSFLPRDKSLSQEEKKMMISFSGLKNIRNLTVNSGILRSFPLNEMNLKSLKINVIQASDLADILSNGRELPIVEINLDHDILQNEIDNLHLNEIKSLKGLSCGIHVTSLKFLEGMENLQSLKLMSASVSDNEFKYMEKLPLTELMIGASEANPINGSGLKHVNANLLQHLEISSCKDMDWTQLQCLHGNKLKTLIIENYNVNEGDTGYKVDTEIIKGFTKLNHLNLRDIEMSVDDLEVLTDIPLTELEISWNESMEELPDMSIFPKLKTLILNHTFLEEGSFESLSETSIEYLSLEGSEVLADDLRDLIPLNSLKKLNLIGTKLTDKMIGLLVKMKGLEELEIDISLKKEFEKEFKAQMPNVKVNYIDR